MSLPGVSSPAPTLSSVSLSVALQVARCVARRAHRTSVHAAQQLKRVARSPDEARSAHQQGVRPPRRRRRHPPGNRRHGPSQRLRDPRASQLAGVVARLDHDRQAGEHRGNPRTGGPRPPSRLATARQLRHRAPSTCYPLVERSTLGGARNVQAAGDHRHRPALHLQRACERGDLDPVGQPARDGHSACGQPAREALRHLHAVVGRPAATDDGHGRHAGQRMQSLHAACHVQQRWTGPASQPGRVGALVAADRLHAVRRAHIARLKPRVGSPQLPRRRPPTALSSSSSLSASTSMRRLRSRQTKSSGAPSADRSQLRRAQSRHAPLLFGAHGRDRSCRATAGESRVRTQRQGAADVPRSHTRRSPFRSAIVRATRSTRCCPARAQQAALPRAPNDLLALAVEPHVPLQHAHVHVRVHGHPVLRQTRRLALARTRHLLARLRASSSAASRPGRAAPSRSSWASRSMRSSSGPLSRRR